MNKFTSLALSSVFLFPVVTLAGGGDAPDLGFFDALLAQLTDLVNAAIPFVIALALLFFFWGVFQFFILGADDEDKRTTGRAYMVYGLIGLVAIVAVWGLVQLIINILGVGTANPFTAPEPPR